ncbi:hypothetical protein YB2330_002579 [Saitoella coloradoensis]
MSAAFNGTITPLASDENALAELSKLAKLRDQVRQNSHPSLKRRREELESPPHEFVAAAAAAGVSVKKGKEMENEKEEAGKPKPSEDKLRLEQLLRAKIAAKKAEIGSKTATPNPGSSVPTPTETPAPTLPQQPQFPFPPPPFPFIPGFLPPLPIPGMPFPPPIPGLGIPAPPLPQLPSATSQTTPAPAQVAANTGFGVGPPPLPTAAPPPPPPELAAMIAASTSRPGSGVIAPPPEVVPPPVHAPNVVRSLVEAKVNPGAVPEVGRGHQKTNGPKSPAAKKQKIVVVAPPVPAPAAPGRVILPPEPERTLPAPGKGDHRSDAKPPTGPAALTNKQPRSARDRMEKKARHYSSFDSPPRVGEVVLPYDTGMGLPYDSAPVPAPTSVTRAASPPPRKVEGGLKGSDKDKDKEKLKAKKVVAEEKPKPAAVESARNTPSNHDEPKAQAQAAAPAPAVLDHSTITRQQFPPIHHSQLTVAVEDVRMRSPPSPPLRVPRERDDIRAPRPMGPPLRQPLATEAEQQLAAQDEHEEYDPTRADLHFPRRRASQRSPDLGRGPGQGQKARARDGYGYARASFGYEEYDRYGPGPERRYGYGSGMDEDRERERGRSLVRRRSPRHFDRRSMSPPTLITDWQRDPEERERMKSVYPDDLDSYARAPSVVPPPRIIRAESRAPPPRGGAYGYGSEYGSAAGYLDEDREHVVRDQYVEQRMADLARKKWELEQQERELTRMAMAMEFSRRHGMDRDRDREGSMRPPPSMYGSGHGMEEEKNRWGMPPPPLPMPMRERSMYPVGRREGSVYPGGREGSVRPPPPVYAGGHREASRSPPPMRDDEYSPRLGRMMLPPPPPPPPISYRDREVSVRPGWEDRMPPPARAASVRPIAIREQYEDRMRYLDRTRRDREYEYDHHEYPGPGRGRSREREWR